MKQLIQDYRSNRVNPTKGKYIVILFRLAQIVKQNKVLYYLFFFYLLFYRFFVEWILGAEVSWNCKIGSNFQIWHGTGLVIHPRTTIGSGCVLRQCTTIGVKNSSPEKAPVLGNNVDVGANCVIIGDIVIGDNVTIGAGTVVVKNVPSNSIIVSSYAIIRNLNGGGIPSNKIEEEKYGG